MRRAGAPPFYFFPAATGRRSRPLGDEPRPARRPPRRRARRERALPRVAALAPLPPRRRARAGPRGRREPPAPLRGGRAGAQANGYELFHLGGGVGGAEDSLWEYKRRFAPGGARRGVDRQGRARRGRVPGAEQATPWISTGSSPPIGPAAPLGPTVPPMNVLYFDPKFATRRRNAPTRAYSFARHLVEQGDRVTVVGLDRRATSPAAPNPAPPPRRPRDRRRHRRHLDRDPVRPAVLEVEADPLLRRLHARRDARRGARAEA